MKKMKINDFSKACGIPAGTLRFYEKMGYPSSMRTKSGYRQYENEDVFRINTFNALTAQGFSLSEAGKLIHPGPSGTYCSALEEKNRSLEKELWLLGKRVEWNRMMLKVYRNFAELENRPFEISIPEFRFLPCTDGHDPTPSLKLSRQVSQFVSLLPASCYAAYFQPGAGETLGIMLETSVMQEYGISCENTVPGPAGKTVAVLVRDYQGEDPRKMPVLAPFLSACPAQPAVFIVHLMVETEEYGPWPQFMLCHCPE